MKPAPYLSDPWRPEDDALLRELARAGRRRCEDCQAVKSERGLNTQPRIEARYRAGQSKKAEDLTSK
jgi:hypothetical protein